MFLVGPFYVSNIPVNLVIQVVAFGVGTFLSAVILYKISESVIHKLNKNL